MELRLLVVSSGWMRASAAKCPTCHPSSVSSAAERAFPCCACGGGVLAEVVHCWAVGHPVHRPSPTPLHPMLGTVYVPTPAKSHMPFLGRNLREDSSFRLTGRSLWPKSYYRMPPEGLLDLSTETLHSVRAAAALKVFTCTWNMHGKVSLGVWGGGVWAGGRQGLTFSAPPA
jgi:hypothetical protein